MHRIYESHKTLLYPLKQLSSQATKSHARKAKSYKPQKNLEWNNAAYEVKRKKRKVLQFHTPTIRHNQSPSPFQPKRKIGYIKK